MLSLKDVRFPAPQDEIALHGRVTTADPLAPPDLFASFTDPLVNAVQRDLHCDADTARDAAIDALFEYLDSPIAFDQARGRLSTFLIQIAKRRAIDRLRTRSAEMRREEEFGAIVELRTSAPNEEMERSAEAEGLWRKIEQTVQNERDRVALSLILDGERSTEVLAGALGIQAVSEFERQREVKRHRDRLLKILERLGAGLRNE